MAKASCDWTAAEKKDDVLEAVRHMGLALHPIQDWVAHGDFGRTEWPDVWTFHNVFSSQTTFGPPGEYPDRTDLDAVGGSDGRAAGSAITVVSVGGAAVETAQFTPGTQRINKTESVSRVALGSFLAHVRDRAKPGGSCICLLPR